MIINLAKIRFGGGGGAPVKPEDSFQETYTANGSYDITPEEGHVFSDGHVEVDVHPTESLSLTITESGSYTSNDEFSGYSINVDVEGPKPEETLTQTITENGSHVFNPSEGHVFNSASITVDVPQGITPTGTINISDNGTYDVTDKATAVVAVGGKDYRYRTGTPDVAGLAAIGWTADDIGYYSANAPSHYAWENDNYKVSQENLDLYSLDDPQPSLYKDNPNVTFVPNKNMSSYFSKPDTSRKMKYIKGIPLYVSNATNMSYMFYGYSSLQTIPPLDTSNVTNMKNMFMECTSLTSIPQMDTSNVTDMQYMFYQCTSLTSIPQMDASKVTSMNSMFDECSSLTSIPQMDTSNVKDMQYMLRKCKKLTSIPQMDTSKVTSMNAIFEYNSSLTSIPQMDTSNVTDMNNMFNYCSSLTSVPQMNTSKVKRMDYMFNYCSNLQRVDGIDFSSLTSSPSNFFGTYIPYLTHFIVNGSISFSWIYGAFTYTSSLDYESIKSILEAMNRTTNTDAKTMKFNAALLDRDGELTALVASCSAKGWTITGLNIYTQPIIESITPSKDHITVSNIKYNDVPDIVTLTVNAREDWVAGGIPDSHGDYFGIYYDYYDATTDIKTRDGIHRSTSGAWNPQSGSVGETVLTPDYRSSAPSPQSGEYALVGISFRNAKSPYLYQDYYFKVYPDGE